MEWLGWLVALLALAGAAWSWRGYRAERARADELLYEKMDLENELDSIHAERVANPPPPPVVVVAAPELPAPDAPHPALTHLDELATQLDDYRKHNRAYDTAVQHCLQPLELLIGADQETMAAALAHIDAARKPLFAARAAVQKSPLHRDAEALDAARRSLAPGQPDEPPAAPAAAAPQASVVQLARQATQTT